MNRSMIFAVAMAAASTAPATTATSAEAVETAIADWVAAIDAAPEWSATFDTLAFDRGADTAVLSGLTIAYSPTRITARFEPISVVGLVKTADNTFAIDLVATDGVTIAGETFEATVADIRYEDLGNLSDNFDELVAWDPLQPFTSLVRAYARVLDIRLGRAEIASLTMTAEDNGEKVVLSYEGLALEDWANGKIEHISTGPFTIAAAGVAEPFSMTISGTEARGIDYAAMMRIYDPDQYIDGVGDLIWHNAAEFIGYGTLIIASPEAKVTVGGASMEGLRVRQPERSFNAFLDRAMFAPNEPNEPTPDELRDLLGYLASFAVGNLSVTGIEVDAKHGGSGNLGEIRFVDMSAEGLGEFALSDLRASAPGQGHFAAGLIAFGGIMFPPINALVDAAEAEARGQPFDYQRLTTQLSFFETSAIDIDIPDSPRVKLGNARLDLGNYVGAVPTQAAVDIDDFDLPANAIEEPAVRAMWLALGYDRIRGDLGARLEWDESSDSVAIDDVRFAIENVGELSVSALLDGLSREQLKDLDSLAEALTGLNFVRGSLSLRDYAILDHWIDQQASLTGSDPALMRRQVAVLLSGITAVFANGDFRQQLQRTITAAVMAPGSITANAAPAAPVPLIALAAIAQAAPASLPDLLGLTVESRPAP